MATNDGIDLNSVGEYPRTQTERLSSMGRTAVAMGSAALTLGFFGYMGLDLSSAGAREADATRRSIERLGYHEVTVSVPAGPDKLFGDGTTATVRIGACIVGANVDSTVNSPGRLGLPGNLWGYEEPADVTLDRLYTFDGNTGYVVVLGKPEEAAGLPIFANCFPEASPAPANPLAASS